MREDLFVAWYVFLPAPEDGEISFGGVFGFLLVFCRFRCACAVL